MSHTQASVTNTARIISLAPAGPWLRLLMGAPLLVFFSACQFVDMARFSYANSKATLHWENDQRTTTIPFTLIDNHIVMPVRVNGSEPLNFVLDSGAGASVIIDSRGSRRLQLEMGGEISVSGVGDGPNPVARIVPDTAFSLGDVSLGGQSVIFLPLESIPFFDDLDDVYFDGVIGAPFFTRFVIEIDHNLQQVSFTDPSVAKERFSDEWQEVGLEIESGVPYMTAQVDVGRGLPVDVKLLVDTGFRGALSLTPSTDEKLEKPIEYFQAIGEGLSGDVVSQVAMSESLTLAGYRLSQLPVSYAISGGESEDGSNGIVGNEVLQQFNLVFDYARERLLFTPSQNFPTSIGADRSGLQVRPHAAGGIVKRIAPGSTGELSPLQVGDIITTFDDVPVSYASVAELKRTLATDRESVHLCWQSGVRQHCDDLLLASRFRVQKQQD
jgi:predicted aspartyl protease